MEQSVTSRVAFGGSFSGGSLIGSFNGASGAVGDFGSMMTPETGWEASGAGCRRRGYGGS